MGETTPTGGRHKGAAMYCHVWLSYARTSAGTHNLFGIIYSLLLLERTFVVFYSRRLRRIPKNVTFMRSVKCISFVFLFLLARELKKHVRRPRWPAGCDAGDW